MLVLLSLTKHDKTMCVYVRLMSIHYEIIIWVGEGITVTDGACRSVDRVCDLHRSIWIKRNARIFFVKGHPTVTARSLDHIWSSNSDCCRLGDLIIGWAE